MRLRAVVTGLITGLMFVGSVWAGTALSPVGVDASDPVDVTPNARPVHAALGESECDALAAGELCAGAAAISLEPDPQGDDVWITDRDECLPMSLGGLDPEGVAEHVFDLKLTWVENPGCIYMGGYGLGPSNPVTSWDQEYGLWVRSFAYSDGTDTLILTLLDAEGYFGEYNNLCGPTPCGAFAIADRLAEDLGVSPHSLVISSTHSHTSLDLIGGWGGVPTWYMEQVTNAIIDSATQAFESMQPATLEAGDTLARAYNGERRDTYRSAEDPTLNWMRARDRTGRTISTVGTYAAHPVSFDEGLGIGHGDYPPVFAARAQERFGGVAGIFPAGLGNMSPRQGPINNGKGLANLIPDLGEGTLVENPDVRVKRQHWQQPVTNGPLLALGGAVFFDRPFGGPAAVTVSKGNTALGSVQPKPCVSASAVSVNVAVTAAKIGDVVITSAPGEIFANFSNTIEERSPITALAIGQANDALGYMPQEFEADRTAQQGLGFIGEGYFEYEDAYAIDECFGDMALETTLGLLGSL